MADIDTEENTTLDSMVWNDLWFTMKQAKADALCCIAYPTKIRRRRKVCNWIVIGVLGLGAGSYPFSTIATLCATILGAIGQIMKDMTKAIIQPESELCQLDSFYKKFSDILIDLEDTLLDFRLHRLNDEEAKDRCFENKHRLADAEAQMTPLVELLTQKEHDKFDSEADEYLNAKFNI